MANIHREVVLDAPAADIWSKIEDPARINEWFTFLGEVSWNPDTNSRTCSMGEATLDELVLDVDAERRRFAYAIRSGPMPLEHHSASMEVTERDGKTVLVWDHDFLPDAVADGLAEAVDGAIAVIGGTPVGA